MELCFQCAGIVLLAVGTEYKWYLDDYYPVTPDHQYYLNVAPSGCIVIGAAITFIGLFGYWGAAQENNCILNAVSTLIINRFTSRTANVTLLLFDIMRYSIC